MPNAPMLPSMAYTINPHKSFVCKHTGPFCVRVPQLLVGRATSSTRLGRTYCNVAKKEGPAVKKDETVEARLGVTLSDEMMRMILGEADPAAKLNAYEESLHSWWMEYADRKNSEECEHVADSLLYDERCHLPRTTPPPPCVERIEIYRRSLDSMSSEES